MTPGHPDSAVDAAPRIPAPRTATGPADRTGDDGSASGGLSAIARARIRESATRNAAAAALFGTGRYHDAVPLFEQALASCRSTLGGEHPTTLTVAGNLGVAYVAAGHRRKGIQLITTNLAARVRVLGDTHPDTLTARNALAAAHRKNGDADAAVAVARQVVVQRNRILGATHVDTLSSRMGLALALAAAGDLTSAHRLLSSTIAVAEATLGREHEHTTAFIECGEAAGLLRREV